MLKGFRDFILRGNVVDLAVAVIIGAAFNKIVASLVADVINPLISSTVGQPNFSYIVLNVHGGKVTIGNFLNAVIEFLIVASVVYFAVVMPMHWFLQRVKKPDAPPPSPTTKTCPECLSEIPIAARRCAHCAQPVPQSAPAA
ncbi:MAG: large conductance mechanosensitive channel protein MscL [Acidobacteriota bacterium]